MGSLILGLIQRLGQPACGLSLDTTILSNYVLYRVTEFVKRASVAAQIFIRRISDQHAGIRQEIESYFPSPGYWIIRRRACESLHLFRDFNGLFSSIPNRFMRLSASQKSSAAAEINTRATVCECNCGRGTCWNTPIHYNAPRLVRCRRCSDPEFCA